MLKSSETNIISDDIVNELFVEKISHKYIVWFDPSTDPFGYSIPFSWKLSPNQSVQLTKILKENIKYF